MRLDGTLALITGAASGLGRATAERLYAAGAKLLLTDLDGEAVARLSRTMGDRALPFDMDVCDPEQIEAALSQGEKKLGPLRVAVNCAGIASAEKTVTQERAHDWALWRRVIEVNLTGTFMVSSLAALHMSRNEPDADSGERGVIVNTASIAAFDGQRGQAAYAASKAGVVGLTLPVARDLADRAIRCIALAPGVFDTPMLSSLNDKGRDALSRGFLFPQRAGRVQEFAALVAHVVENSYLNATCMRLDGGSRLP